VTASPTPPPTTSVPLVSFDDTGMTFTSGTSGSDATTALHRVSLDVAPGEFISVVGPSGCGKSTLLRLASGLETSTEGVMTTSTDRVAYVFQDATLLPWRTVGENVMLLGELDGLSKADRERRCSESLATVGLEGFEGHLPHQLSGGMRMRVSLARALTIEPELFLFDEPFAALDEITRERLGVELTQLFAEKRFGGLFITHSVNEAVFISTKVAVMSGRPGTIVDEVDVPFDFPRDPKLRFSPEFTALTERVSNSLMEAHS
jgi:NitT/TauT family transport system ATP-binding protein